MRLWRALTFAVLAMGTAPASPADACSCVMGSPLCETYWEAESVFTGTVAAIGQEMVTRFDQTYAQNLVQFDAVTVWRGTAGDPVQVRTGMGGGDCGYNFKVGQTYIVYTYRAEDGRLETGICNRTAPIDKASEDLEYIRSLPPASKDALGQIVGQASRQELDATTGSTATNERAKRPITVTLTGRQQFTIESRDGRFDARVPPGKYKVDVRAPDGFYAIVYPEELFLADPRACASVSVRISADGRVSGRVLDARGAPVAGIGVHAAPAREGLGHLDIVGTTHAVTDDDGRFVISRLAQGAYLVGPYVPGVPRSASAARNGGPTLASSFVRVALDPSAEEQIGELRLPQSVELGAIRGTVLDTDGRPARDIRVSLEAASDDEKPLRFDNTTTDERGQFVLAGPAGRRYTVVASRSVTSIDDDGRQQFAQWETETESPIAPGETITLTLRPLKTP
jgi:5-hydroxyisourate hydrolase-like protein (transthyretin family)